MEKMDELLDMIIADESQSQISDQIKDILFSKSAERIDQHKPIASSSLFGDNDNSQEED